MSKAGKNRPNEIGADREKTKPADKKPEHSVKQAQPLKPADLKEDEKLHGLVDEDHPFPPKGN
ncbi:hypothetical protein [Herminiimonas aquatilis]|uniref:Uncharacterized protein n=1 Tax=Herminiimonas aquatilis TaxID=345342 RepID=A0ABW2JA67_9BURK